MKNYAIVIGVSEYNHAQCLPACKNDAETMGQLLQATEKYDVLIISEKIGKAELLEKIESFLPIESNDSIGELFFYFSGHGMQNTETYFVLYDTDLAKINSTALKNSEIDDLVRRRNPSLYVKIIDACQSGLEYIKEISAEKECLNIQPPQYGKALKNCIFMCSSQKNQSSLATKEYSYFTKSFLSSITEFSEADKIKYSDIQNHIADDFQTSNIDQTPQFVTQSSGNDIFTYMCPAIKVMIASLQESAAGAPATSAQTDAELKVNQFLEKYRSEEQAVELLNMAKKVMNEMRFPESWLSNYYTFQFKESSHSHYEEEVILRFLYQKRTSENLYVDIETNEVAKASWINPLNTLRTVPIRFSSKANNLPTFCAYWGESKKDGLPRYEISFVFIYSDTYFYVLVSNKEYRYKGWRYTEEGDSTKYVYTKFEYSDFTETVWRTFLAKRLEESKAFIEKSVESFVTQ